MNGPGRMPGDQTPRQRGRSTSRLRRSPPQPRDRLGRRMRTAGATSAARRRGRSPHNDWFWPEARIGRRGGAAAWQPVTHPEVECAIMKGAWAARFTPTNSPNARDINLRSINSKTVESNAATLIKTRSWVCGTDRPGVRLSFVRPSCGGCLVGPSCARRDRATGPRPEAIFPAGAFTQAAGVRWSPESFPRIRTLNERGYYTVTCGCANKRPRRLPPF